jgi:hypothetical protein
MTAMLMRIVQNLVARLNGPLTLRLILQPLTASIIAIRAGIADARLKWAPYLWAVLTDPARRRSLLRAGWKDIGAVFTVAVVLDVIYQVIARRWVYPGEAVLVAVLLAVVPYLALRGPARRFMRARIFKKRKEIDP